MPRLHKELIKINGTEIFILRIDAKDPRGVIVIPPLIGGNALQQYHFFKVLSRSYTMVLFEYRGHGKSKGQFDIRNSIEDTKKIVDYAYKINNSQKIYGLADCYGSIPLMKSVSDREDIFESILLINPIPNLQYTMGPKDVLKHYFLRNGKVYISNPFDLKDIVFYINCILFPDIEKSKNHFGLLNYSHLKAYSLLRDYLFYRIEKKIQIKQVPVCIFYGTKDSLLRLDNKEEIKKYEHNFLKMIKNLTIKAIEGGDHFFIKTNNKRKIEQLQSFFTHLPSLSAGTT